MKNYKTLQQFAKSFNITDCYNKRFMKRKGGYVFDAVINDKLVDVVITPIGKDNQPVVFCGNIANKTIQALQQSVGFNYKMIEKVLAV